MHQERGENGLSSDPAVKSFMNTGCVHERRPETGGDSSPSGHLRPWHQAHIYASVTGSRLTMADMCALGRPWLTSVGPRIELIDPIAAYQSVEQMMRGMTTLIFPWTYHVRSLNCFNLFMTYLTIRCTV